MADWLDAMALPLVHAARRYPVGPRNPMFDPAEDVLDAEPARMRAEPRRLDRPVLVLGGYRSWPNMASLLAKTLRALVGDEPGRIVSVSYTLQGNMDRCAAMAAERARAAFGASIDGGVDVVGISMGGLVGRLLACDPPEGVPARPRLPVRRLFTLASPHRGALLAEKIAPDIAARDMKPGSRRLGWLDERLEGCRFEQIVPYAVLHDSWVGATRASPVGMDPYWTRGSAVMSHFSVSVQDTVVLDLARRLRGEEPFSALNGPPPMD